MVRRRRGTGPARPAGHASRERTYYMHAFFLSLSLKLAKNIPSVLPKSFGDLLVARVNK
jgi:hypothetical protein